MRPGQLGSPLQALWAPPCPLSSFGAWAPGQASGLGEAQEMDDRSLRYLSRCSCQPCLPCGPQGCGGQGRWAWSEFVVSRGACHPAPLAQGTEACLGWAGLGRADWPDRSPPSSLLASTRLAVLSSSLTHWKKLPPLPSLTSQPHQVLASEPIPFSDLQQVSHP